MKTNKLIPLIKYEFLNTLLSFFTPFFGIVFPIVMAIFLTQLVPLSSPLEFKPQITTAITISIATTIPLVMALLNFPAAFSQEIESQIIFRLSLFNINLGTILTAKIIVFLAIQTLTLILYATILTLINPILIPHWTTLTALIICLYLLTIIYFLIAFSLSMILKKFSTTYAISMSLYFFILFLGGGISLPSTELPTPLQTITNMLPSTYIAKDFVTFWQSGLTNYNFAPLVQSLILLSSIGIILYFITKYKNKQEH
ncbi:MAG: ABC transporter permease [Culicoidibacterales bacterium]